MRFLILFLSFVVLFIQSAKAEGIFYQGCQYLYLQFEKSDVYRQGDNGFSYFAFQDIMRYELSDEYVKDDLDEKLCVDFFKKFYALYGKKEFYENLRKASEIREEKLEIYSEISKLEEKKRKYDPKYDYKKLDSKLESLNAKSKELDMQIPSITKYKEFQDIFEYLERTKPLIDKKYPEWQATYNEEIKALKERYARGEL